MSKPSRLESVCASQTYFITSSTSQKKSLFQSDLLAQLFLQTLFQYREKGNYLMHEFVVMPNHFHLLITPAIGITLEKALQLIKGGFSFRAKAELAKNMEIWQRGFTDRRVRDSAEYGGFVAYIHENPVQAGLVERPELYPYSSAFPGFALDPPPVFLTSAAKAGVI